MISKVCKHCEKEKALSDFYTFQDKWSGNQYFSSRCKPCHLQHKRANPNRPSNQKAEKLKLRYGLTYEEWEQMRLEQDYSCMICGITEDEIGQRLDVDHCHTSGKVRGVLCNPCNNMIAKARDDELILLAAARYLAHNKNGYKD